jgi:triosephosphate isomerase
MVIRMLKSVLPAQSARQLPLTIVTDNNRVTIDNYAWIECRSEGSGLAGRNIYRALTARRQLFICLDEGEQRLQPLDFAEEILAQLAGMFRNVTAAAINQVTIVYRPQWSQECWLPADAQRIRIAHRQIRDLLTERYGSEVARQVAIVYGGSLLETAQPQVIDDINVDGLLYDPFERQNKENEVRK